MAKRALIDVDDFSSLKTELPPGRDAGEALRAIVGPESASQETAPPIDFAARAQELEARERLIIAQALVRAALPDDPLVPFPLQLPFSMVAALRRLKRERGLIPAHIVRQAVAKALAELG